METDIRIILFFILFLFALNTNKENYTNVTPVISDKPIEHNRKIKNFYNDIYKYDTESNYNIQPLYDMLYLLEDKLRDTKKGLHYFDKTTCPDGSDKCVTCSPPELTEGAIFKECGNDIDGYQVIPSGETCELGCVEGYHVFGSPPVIGTCQLMGNSSPRPDELFSGEFRGSFLTEPYIQCSPDKQCGEHTKHIGSPPDKECICEPHYFGQSCEILCDESPSNQIDHRTKEFIGKKFDPLQNRCELYCVNGESNPSQTKCICSPSPFWEGTYCQEIKCVHGRYNKDRTECTDCDPGWTGLHCHQPKCSGNTEKYPDGDIKMDGDKCKCKEDWFGDTCETYCKNPGGKPMEYSDGRTTCICAPGYYGHGCATQCSPGKFFNEKFQKCSPIPQDPKDCLGEWNNCSRDPSNNNKCMQKYEIISPLENGGSPCPYNNNQIRDCLYGENGCHRNIDPKPGDNPDEEDDTDQKELNKKKFVAIILIPIIPLIVIFTLSKYTKKHHDSKFLVDSGMFHIFITFPFIASCIGLIISYFINRDDLFKFNLNGYILGSCFITFCVSLLLVNKFRRNDIAFKLALDAGNPRDKEVVATRSRTRREQYSAFYYGIFIVGVIIFFVFKLPGPDTPTGPTGPTGPTNTPTGPTGPTGPTKKINCFGEWLSVNCLSTGKMTYKIRRPASNGGSPCPYKDGEVSPSDHISSQVCPDSKRPASCVPKYGDCGGVNCTKKIIEVIAGRGDTQCKFYEGQTVSCSPSECSRNPPSPLDPGEGNDINDQPDHSIQIINKTSDLLSLFISNSDSTYRNISWYDANKVNTDEGVTIYKPVNWGEGNAKEWDPLGAHYATQVNIKKDKKVILNIPERLRDPNPGGGGQRNNQFIIKPIKLNTTERIDEKYIPEDGPFSIKTVVPTQVPNFFELGEGAVSDSSGVDGVNYRITYQLTSDDETPIKTEIKDNPCPPPGEGGVKLDIGCSNPVKNGCLNFEGGIDPKATASCQGDQNCAFNECSQKYFKAPDENQVYFNNPHHNSNKEKKKLNESWSGADSIPRMFDGGIKEWKEMWDGKGWPEGEQMPPVKYYIGDRKNIKEGTDLQKYCEALNNLNDDFSTYCYDYADKSSSRNLLSPYKVKIIFYDL